MIRRFRNKRFCESKKSLWDTLCDDYFGECSKLNTLTNDYPVSIYQYRNNPFILITVSKTGDSKVTLQEISVDRDGAFCETFDETNSSEFAEALSYAREICK